MQKISSYRFAVKYGLILGAIPAVYNTILVIFDLLLEYHGEGLGPLVMFISLFILPPVISVAIFFYKKSCGGHLKLKEAYIIGLEIGLIAILIMILYDVIFNTVLAPSFQEAYYERHGEEIFEHFAETSDNAEKEFERHKNMRIQFWTFYSSRVIVNLVVGLITSTIAGLIMRTKQQKTQNSDENI